MHPGLLPENANKNRYDNILPSSAQVKLFPSEVDCSETYINADLIEFQQRFILTQAPLSNTTIAFWKMIWDYKVDQIVVLCTVEQGKCERYWPKLGQPIDAANLVIQCREKRSPVTGLKCYQLEIGLDQNSHSVELVYDKRWPDFGVPDSISVAFDLLSQLYGDLIVIHCSAGVGRSGTLCLIKAALSLSLPLHKLSKLLAKLRTLRHGAVSNKLQYEYACRVLESI